MPELSRFFGIVIRMFVEAGGSHHLPHLHAYYQEHVGICGIDPIELIEDVKKLVETVMSDSWSFPDSST